MMNTIDSILANQDESGIPTMSEWDYYAMQFNPIARANHPFVPDTQDAHGGQGFTQIAPSIPFENPYRLIVWDYNQNYQGIAPMELQPQYDPPPPWEAMA